MLKLKQYINSKETNQLHSSVVASMIKQFDDEKFTKAIELIPAELLGDVALDLPDRFIVKIITNTDIRRLVVALDNLESDDQLEMIQAIEQIDQQKAQKLVLSLTQQDQQDIQKLKMYHDDQAGSHMQTEVFQAKMSENVHDIIKRFATLKKSGELEHIQNLFITDDTNTLKHTIGLDDLLVFEFGLSLEENIQTNKDNFDVIWTKDTDDIKDVVYSFEQYDLSVIPVVDKRHKLIGRITSDDIYDIINSQATKQIYNLAGVDDDAEEYENIYKSTKTRAIWLAINLFTAILASVIIALFVDTLGAIVALAVLMPIVASMGGNAGTQSLTVAVRRLALGDIDQRDATRIVKKELVIALVNGLIFGFVTGVISAIWFDIPNLGFVIAISMLINILVAGFFGASIPLVLQKFKIDPAIGSTVVLTTITDVVGFFLFLWLATLILL
jgi:magnesium transporter